MKPLERTKYIELLANLLFDRFSEKVRTTFEQAGTVPGYTDHGLAHIRGVEEAINYLLTFEGWACSQNPQIHVPITRFERLLLQFCAWSHDLGMNLIIAKEFQQSSAQAHTGDLRKEHDQASAHYLIAHLPKFPKEIIDELKGGRLRGLRPFEGPDACRERMSKTLSSRTGATDEELGSFFQFLTDSANSVQVEAGAESLAYTVNLIAKYHRRAESFDTCPAERDIWGQPVRIKLLAAIFRLADALHIDRTRFVPADFETLRSSPEFTEINRIHWIKSHIINSIRIDPVRYTVTIQADLPEHSSAHAASPVDRIEDGMLTWIKNDLEEDVMSVSQILLQNGFPPLVGVNCETQKIPAMEHPDEIRTALSNISALGSPNTSELIRKALKSLEITLVEAQHLEDDPKKKHLTEKIQSHTAAMREQLQQRSCHEGLQKLSAILDRLLQVWGNPDYSVQGALANFAAKMGGKGTLLWNLLQGIHRAFEDQRESVRTGGLLDGAFDGYSHFVLYGFSEQVMSLLQKQCARAKQSFKIHILECRTKTQYSSSRSVLYHDGLRYAAAIRRALDSAAEPQKRPEITLEPDAAVGHILKSNRDRQSAILLGSNTVFSDGTSVHSLGHVAVAAAAKAPLFQSSCKVIVLTDSLKISPETPSAAKGSRDTERNPEGWLTPERQHMTDLQKLGVSPKNWQEDFLDGELIDAMVIVDRNRLLERENFDQLRDLAFDPFKAFADALEHRLLAALIAHSRDRNTYRDELSACAPHRGVDEQNWSAAESFLSEPQPKQGKPRIQIPSRLAPWLSTLWANSEKNAAEVLKKAFPGYPASQTG